MTSEIVAEQDLVLSVGDTTFLDYDNIIAKTEAVPRWVEVEMV